MIKKRAAGLKYSRHNVWKRAVILLHVFLLCSHSDVQHVDNQPFSTDETFRGGRLYTASYCYQKKLLFIIIRLISLCLLFLIFICIKSMYCYLLGRQRLHKPFSHGHQCLCERWQVSRFHHCVACYRKHSKLSCNIAFNVSTKCHIATLPKDVTRHQWCTFVFAVVYTVNLY